MADAQTCSGCGKLLIVSHVTHYLHDGHLSAYGPYAREIDVWADLFDEVRIVAPLLTVPPPGDTLAFTRSHIRVVPVPETGGTTVRVKLRQALLVPSLNLSLLRAMRTADVVHVRCPGNVGLLGAIVAPLVAPRRIAKYAGQWGGYPGEARTYRLQRAILGSRWWGAPVTVYGEWPHQAAHVVPFFTSVLSDAQMARARAAAQAKQLGSPIQLLFVGRLSAAKRVDAVVRALALLTARGVSARLAIVGDGPERASLEGLAARLGVADLVEFAGALPFDEVLGYYERAHVLALVSETEGWPKAIAEAMAFGLVCIGSDRGAVPWLLGEGRGRAVPVGDAAAVADVVTQLARNPDEHLAMSRAAAAWSQRFTLEGLREALRDLMQRSWGVELRQERTA